jgi:4-diphosphocytidyl-2-C-methyl-D-erythritol kinase
MTALRETARAKLNLTLEVAGRRPDGFHELLSLVAFAAVGDEIEFEPGGALVLVLEVEGPRASALDRDNLIVNAARAAAAKVPSLQLGRFRLVKRLPVASGLGGGSADAAAALRLISRANPGALPRAILAELAASLGSDVAVCLTSRPALISGRGEKVEPVSGFPRCGVLLANPGQPLATKAVYAALRAKPLAAPRPHSERLDFHGDFGALLAYAMPRGNDLERPAAELMPEIGKVLAALRALDGARLARLSGSGPTCFGLFASEQEASRAGAKLAAERPDWWIAAAALGA